MEIELIKLLATALLAIVGWIFGGWLASRRDVSNKRRELVVRHLVEAYKVLTQEIGRRETTPNSITKFENILSEIQLFGSKHQVDLARKLSNQTAQEGVSKIDPLVEDMRDSLRRELGLEPVTGRTIWLRFTDEYKEDLKGKST